MQMTKEEILNNIFDNDPLGILEVKAKNPILTEYDRLKDSFEEINSFFEINNREPKKATSDINERRLFSRLEGIKLDIEKIEKLKQFDRFNLLVEV